MYHNDHPSRHAMSVKVMGRVWDADLPPNLKIVLLAYADAAEHDGTEIWPGWKRIATMTGYSRTTVARLTTELLELGVLVQIGAGHRGRRASYLIDLAHPILIVSQDETQSESVPDAPDRVPSDAERVPPVVPLPSSTSVLPSRPTTRPRNPIWDSLVELFGEPSPNRQSIYGRVTKYLQNQDATPDEIRRRAARIVTDWGPEKLTLTSLETHWSRFDGAAGQITEQDVRRFQRSTVEATTYPADHPAAIAKRKRA